MRLWDLPGARLFIDSTCDLLRGGTNVVIRFPGPVPEGFDAAVAATLGNALDVSRLPVTTSPLRDLAKRYATHRSHIHRLPDLCDDPRFRGRLVSLDGLDTKTWPPWRSFLSDYAEASRSRPLMRRSLFLVTLAGTPPAEPPRTDVGLVSRTWDGVLDEVDLLLFASQRLRQRRLDPLLRLLLATTIARVAAWDFDSATALVTQGDETIMEPVELLRAFAREKGWTTETPIDWHVGTASQAGIAHPARAALDDPPTELDRRLWSAQLSVLLPWVETRRHEIVATNLFEVKRQMRANGNGEEDPFGLELGELHKLFSRRGAHRRIRKTVSSLRDIRNELAHRRHVRHTKILDLMAISKPGFESPSPGRRM